MPNLVVFTFRNGRRSVVTQVHPVFPFNHKDWFLVMARKSNSMGLG